MGVPDCPDTPHILKSTLSMPKGGPVIPPRHPTHPEGHSEHPKQGSLIPQIPQTCPRGALRTLKGGSQPVRPPQSS